MNAHAPIPVLMYHDVSDARRARGFERLTVSLGVLESHLDLLASRGYRPIPASALVDPASLPERSVVITFDDGLDSFDRFAAPALARRGMVATAFVPTAFVGGRAEWLGTATPQPLVMSWRALDDLATAGFEIGAHGHRHLELDIADPHDAIHDLRTSRGLLEDRLGRRVTSMAYPFGYEDARTRGHVADAGYAVACAVGHARHERGDDPLCVRRLLVSSAVDTRRLSSLLDGGARTPEQSLRVAGAPAWRTFRRLRRRWQRP